MHRVLERQLARLGLSEDALPADVDGYRALLARVNETYRQADQDRYLLERALSISSEEMRQLYEAKEREAAGALSLERDKLRRNVAILQATIDSSVVGLMVLDASGRLIAFNRRLVALWGYGREDAGAAGDGHDHVLMPEALARIERPEAFLAMVEAHHALDETTMQRPVRTPEGRILERERATIVDDGACIGSVWHFRDVTALRRQEAELVLAKESAERAARAKADFLANMSHELRTPLNAILGFARILLRGSHGPLEPRRRSFVENIEHAGEHMLKLVNDLLALRRLEEKEPELVERVELTRVTATALELLGPSLEEKSISFALSVDDDASAVRADPQLLLHALVNLLSNAAKFTPNGGHVHVHSHRARAEVAIDVIDDGIGIAEADQPRLFTYFEQLGAKHALGMHGSGIGLALTRKLVESMHGRITVRSAPGQGTRFRITLPAPADARAVEPRGLA